MATAGAAIGLEKAEADAITVAAGLWPVAAVMRVAADRTLRQHTTMAAARFAATHRAPMAERHVPVNPMRQLLAQTAAADRTRHPRITAVVVAAHIKAAVDSKVVVDMPAVTAVDIRVAAVAAMKAADTGNW
jgi:hypothetical protein